MNNSKIKFSLVSEDEPSDEQLHLIMADALQDVIDSKILIKETYDRMMKEALDDVKSRNERKISAILAKK